MSNPTRFGTWRYFDSRLLTSNFAKIGKFDLNAILYADPPPSIHTIRLYLYLVGKVNGISIELVDSGSYRPVALGEQKLCKQLKMSRSSLYRAAKELRILGLMAHRKTPRGTEAHLINTNSVLKAAKTVLDACQNEPDPACQAASQERNASNTQLPDPACHVGDQLGIRSLYELDRTKIFKIEKGIIQRMKDEHRSQFNIWIDPLEFYSGLDTELIILCPNRFFAAYLIAESPICLEQYFPESKLVFAFMQHQKIAVKS